MSPRTNRSDTVPTSGIDHGPVAQRMPRAGTKQAVLVGMLQRDHGASIQELVLETGWKANTVHAALTTLRKSGWQISITLTGKENRYLIA